MNKLVKRLLTGTLAFATILTALPVTAVHASGNQYWTESAERVGYIEHVMNDGSIKSTFNEGHMKVEGETAYCVDINTSFKNGYKIRSDASTRMSSDQIADVALSLEYVKQYTASHTNLNYKRGQLFMELRFVVPNMEKTFGNLEFAGENTTEQQRINGRMAVITRSYNLYSDVQRADDVVVVLPAKAGEKHFSPEQKVKLINPRITTDGYKIGERGFVNYILLADDMLPVESK